MTKKKDEKLTEEQVKESAQEAAAAEETPAAEEPEKGTEEVAEATPEQKFEDLQQQFLLLSADFQNYKRRTEKEKADIYAFANEKIFVQLLDVIDNFERATESTEAEQGKFAEGMQLILKQLQDILLKNGVEEIQSLNEAFDPNFHNAVMTESVEGVEAGKVTKVFQKGYMLNKKVIRPAMVAVSE